MPIPRKTFTTDVAGKELSIELSQLADQANAAVIVKYGETVVLVTAVMSHADVDTDYLPLKVDYEEKFYAAGKIIGSRYVRREGRASDEAILAGRLVEVAAFKRSASLKIQEVADRFINIEEIPKIIIKR